MRLPGLPSSPSVGSAAASKTYVDNIVSNISWKEPVAVRKMGADGATMVGAEELVVEDVALQDDLLIVKKVETGRWNIENNQMIFYDDDGVTPILTCNLYDLAGLPANNDIYERDPI
jgi:hypothetical protein